MSTLQAAMMASESKVADWLAQNDPTLVRSESTEDDSKSNKSIKSDVPVHLKRLKGGGGFLLTFLCLGYVNVFVIPLLYFAMLFLDDFSLSPFSHKKL